MFFDRIEKDKVNRTEFNLSHTVRTSFDMGELVPVLCEEVVPGDVWDLRSEALVRFAPLVSPVMHEVEQEIAYFFVPNRILWSEWEDWITNKVQSAVPTLQIGIQMQAKNLGGYMNLPTPLLLTSTEEVSAFPNAAYNKIYNEYYRDQNLSAEIPDTLVSGTQNAASWTGASYNDSVQRSAWMHDYFTSALPTAQQGDPVLLPLITEQSLDVEYESNGLPWLTRNTTGVLASADPLKSNASSQLQNAANGQLRTLDPNGTLKVDFTGEATDIITVRRAFRLQEWLEKNIRGGQRYTEILQNHFDVRSQDARLQRPEMIGGFSKPVAFSEVLSTAQTLDAGSNEIPIGAFGGHGYSYGGGQRFRYKCHEHGWIIAIMRVRPKTAYFQGIHRKWQRYDQLDYLWPTFEHIGEQEVKTTELYALGLGGTQDPDEVFGYVPRYAEYKFINDTVTGEMRGTLNYWHLARIFDTKPVLNEDFIKCTPSKRIFADTSEDNNSLWVMIHHDIKAERPLSYYSTPKM